jgi:ribonuclease HII
MQNNEDYNWKKESTNLQRIEEQLYEDGYQLIAGTDEVGRGPLADLLSVPQWSLRESRILYIIDSKLLLKKTESYVN